MLFHTALFLNVSGIAGIYYLDGRPVGDEIDRMVDIMEHRGPDEQSTWINGSAGLGHCMLHTTSESLHASLPQESAQSGCVITADVRIDNRGDLINDLRLSTGPDRVIPDSTLILRAYEKWGRDCVNHLLGAFVFAVWDPPLSRSQETSFRWASNFAVDTCGLFLLFVRFGGGFFGSRGCFWYRSRFAFSAILRRSSAVSERGIAAASAQRSGGRAIIRPSCVFDISPAM